MRLWIVIFEIIVHEYRNYSQYQTDITYQCCFSFDTYIQISKVHLLTVALQAASYRNLESKFNVLVVLQTILHQNPGRIAGFLQRLRIRR